MASKLSGCYKNSNSDVIHEAVINTLLFLVNLFFEVFCLHVVNGTQDEVYSFHFHQAIPHLQLLGWTIYVSALARSIYDHRES